MSRLAAFSLADNPELQLYWTIFQGRRSDPSPALPTNVPRSEFGQFADSGGFFLSWDF